MDSEDGSVALITWIPLTLIFSLFVWIALGKVVDILASFQLKFAASSGLPVSPDRVQYSSWMLTGYQALLLFAIVAPVIWYSICVARRRNDSII